jgi:hypothetical protein
MEEKSNNKCNKIYYINVYSVSAPYIYIHLHKIIFKLCVSKATVYSVCSEVHQSGDVKHVRVCACAFLMELVHVTELSKPERR